MGPIVLKDSADADQTFNYKGTAQNGAVIYERQSDNLIGRSQVVLSMAGNTNVLRVKGKLSVPEVCTAAEAGCSSVSVSYTEVGSFDISVPTISSAVSRDDFIAMFSSLVGTSLVSDMATDGVLPTA